MTDITDESALSTPKNAMPGKIGDTRSVKYSAPGSEEYYKIGGTRAWRNNNPGNIGCGPKARSYGAIGCDGSRAIFPDEATGIEAHKKLLTDEKYKNHTLADAIEQWAPPSENPTARYIATVAKRTGIPKDKIIRDMTPDELDRLQSVMGAFENSTAGEIKTETQMRREAAPFAPGRFIDRPSHPSRGIKQGATKERRSDSDNSDRWWDRKSKVFYSGGGEMRGGDVYIGSHKVDGGRILYPVYRVQSDGGTRGSFYSQ